MKHKLIISVCILLLLVGCSKEQEQEQMMYYAEINETHYMAFDYFNNVNYVCEFDYVNGTSYFECIEHGGA